MKTPEEFLDLLLHWRFITSKSKLLFLDSITVTTCSEYFLLEIYCLLNISFLVSSSNCFYFQYISDWIQATSGSASSEMLQNGEILGVHRLWDRNIRTIFHTKHIPKPHFVQLLFPSQVSVNAISVKNRGQCRECSEYSQCIWQSLCTSLWSVSEIHYYLTQSARNYWPEFCFKKLWF